MFKAIALFVVVAGLILFLALRGSGKEEAVSTPAPAPEKIGRQNPAAGEEKAIQMPDRTEAPSAESMKESSQAGNSKPGKPDEAQAVNETDDAQATEADEDDAEDETPTVKRSRLIGGADVEWIEPKPKDPNDKFGEPPM